jgi:hypothetical protein
MLLLVSDSEGLEITDHEELVPDIVEAVKVSYDRIELGRDD